MKITAMGLALAAGFITSGAFAADATTQPAVDDCMDRAQTQADMADCASKGGNAAADRELNEVYRKVLVAHAKDAVFVAKLKTAQRAWIAFRDAELEARFPAKDKQAEYGSSYSMCADGALESMTRQRIKDLRAWLEPVAEGEVCAGSYNKGD
ncbi:lysozyme inhibitor LprI family protein [Dokdonella sp.]|uniref:lysozyme inhibitor LprI family protein n=1 Tax=Dokdonella sp. TaxID=2291710 RepID=UPI0025C68BDB|nr:lysozyme inhibitor LprI family protein [Dokdonella sp.]MBX3689985.1 DUF1311 domain-containing protein [Dokdonella sp.]